MATTSLLTTIDYFTIGIYLVVVVTIGILAGRGQKSSDDYFVQTHTRDELHRVIGYAIVLAHIKNGHNIGMM